MEEVAPCEDPGDGRKTFSLPHSSTRSYPCQRDGPRAPTAALSSWLLPRHGFGCYVAGTCLSPVLTGAGTCWPSSGCA